MSGHSPITPPPELLSRWEEDWHHAKVKHTDLEDHIAAQAAQWGADQELEACCVLMDEWGDEWGLDGKDLMECRRPKPPSLKEQALTELEKVDMLWDTNEFGAETLSALDTIRRALEALDD